MMETGSGAGLEVSRDEEFSPLRTPGDDESFLAGTPVVVTFGAAVMGEDLLDG
jgi:hypothetical protein